MVKKVARRFLVQIQVVPSSDRINLSVKPAVNGYRFDFGKDKATKREGWVHLFICRAQDTVGLLPPLPVWSLP